MEEEKQKLRDEIFADMESWKEMEEDERKIMDAIPMADSDSKRLELIGRWFRHEGGTPFSSVYDPLLEGLSFTNQKIDEQKRQFAWKNFASQNSETTGWVGWPETSGIAAWYYFRGMLDHAASVYEHLCWLMRGEEEEEHDIYDHYPTLMGIYLELSDSARATYFFNIISDLHHNGRLTLASYLDALSEYTTARIPTSEESPENETSILLMEQDRGIRALRKELENERLKTWAKDIWTVEYSEAAKKIKAGLLEKYPETESLDERTIDYLVRAETCFRLRKEPHSTCYLDVVPLFFQKAVEMEFNSKIWATVWKWKERNNERFLPEFDYPDLTLNNIASLIRPATQMKQAMVQPIHRAIANDELFKHPHPQNVVSLSRLAGKARHAQHAQPFSEEELKSLRLLIHKEGWLFKFLTIMHCP